MRRPALRIQQKIVLPFTLLIVAAMLTTAVVSIALISRALELRVEHQIDHVSEMLSQTGFAVNPSILEKLKLIIGAEVVTYTRDGEVIAATLPVVPESELLNVLRAPEMTRRLLERNESLVVRDIRYGATPYKVAYRRLQSPPDAIVALAMPTSDIAEATRPLARTIGVVALVLIVIMVLLSQGIARSITSPLERLVDLTQQVAAGDLTKRTAIDSRDEVGALARAFDDMVRRLRASEQELLHSEKLALTGQLAARVAHDVRNPLSSIKMHAQLLRNQLKPGHDNQQLLGALFQEIDRIERAVTGLLDLSRPPELHLAFGDVHAVVREALRATEAQLRHRKITIHTELDAATPTAWIDSDRLTMAVVNLVMNAADAMPEGGTLTAATSMVDAASLRVEVRDDGLGIDPTIRNKLFNPFFSTKREGVGLGLVNTRNIVERLGGHLELLPNAVKGTRAVITVPIASAPAAADLDAAEPDGKPDS